MVLDPFDLRMSVKNARFKTVYQLRNCWIKTIGFVSANSKIMFLLG